MHYITGYQLQRYGARIFLPYKDNETRFQLLFPGIKYDNSINTFTQYIYNNNNISSLCVDLTKHIYIYQT